MTYLDYDQSDFSKWAFQINSTDFIVYCSVLAILVIHSWISTGSRDIIETLQIAFKLQ